MTPIARSRRQETKAAIGGHAASKADSLDELRFSELGQAQRRLVTLVTLIGFGAIHDLRVRDGQPAFMPLPSIIREIRFGARFSESADRRKSGDFVLKAEQLELLELLVHIGTGLIDVLEIRHGLPFRATFTDERLANEATT